MASIVNDPNGRRRVLFVAPDGSRKTIRLGKCDRKTAESITRHVEALLSAKIGGQPIPRDTAAWLATIGPKLRDKLARAGLSEGGQSVPSLEEFVSAYIERRRASLNSSTILIFQQTHRLLVRYFGESRPINAINAADAADWESWLASQGKTRNTTGGLALATVRKRVRIAKTMFTDALERGLLTSNPFKKLKGATPPSQRREFVSADTINQAIEAAPDCQWRLILALARWGGLRVPSEVLALTWDCVDWHRQRLRIPSPKTVRAGKPYRVIPLFPEIRPHLEAVWEQAEAGVPWIITRHRKSNVNLRTQLLRILAKAGITPWPQLFQSLRKTRATELAREHPRHVATAWLGHTESVAERHYWQVTEEDFLKALGAAQKAAQSGAETSGIERKTVLVPIPEPVELMQDAAKTGIVYTNLVGAKGLEPLTPSVSSWCSSQLS